MARSEGFVMSYYTLFTYSTMKCLKYSAVIYTIQHSTACSGL